MQVFGAAARLVFLAIGGLLFLIGLAWAWSPIPFGFVLMGIGLFVMVAASPMVAKWVRLRRARNPAIDQVIDAVEDRLPDWAKRELERSDPKNGRPGAPDSRPARLYDDEDGEVG